MTISIGPSRPLTAAFNPSQPRVDSGPNGGQWTATGDDGASSGPEPDAATKAAFQAMLGMTPAQRAAFLAKMSPEQLKKMGSLMAKSKTAKGDIAQIRNAVGDTLKAKGIAPESVGLGAKGAAKKPAAKKAGGKGKSGGSKGGGKSSGGKKSGGSSKGGSGKSSGSKSSGSSSSKKTSSGSSASKKTGDVATTTKTSKGKQAAPTPQVVRITPARGGRASSPPPSRTGTPGQSRPQPVRAAGTAVSGQGAAMRIVGPRREEEA